MLLLNERLRHPYDTAKARGLVEEEDLIGDQAGPDKRLDEHRAVDAPSSNDSQLLHDPVRASAMCRVVQSCELRYVAVGGSLRRFTIGDKTRVPRSVIAGAAAERSSEAPAIGAPRISARTAQGQDRPRSNPTGPWGPGVP